MNAQAAFFLARRPSGCNETVDDDPFRTGSPMIDPHSVFLLLSALGAVIGIILLVTVLKLNPFLSLLLASLALAIVSGMPMADVIHSFEAGVGDARAHRHRGRARHHARQDDG